MYLSGMGVDQDPIEAVFWLKLSARQGDAPATKLLDGILLTMPAGDIRTADQKVSEWMMKNAAKSANP
jgi:TPR repeat protein